MLIGFCRRKNESNGVKNMVVWIKTANQKMLIGFCRRETETKN